MFIKLMPIAILVIFSGCSRSLEYSVDIRNHSGGDIDQATASYVDKSWKFEFGYIQNGSGASFGGLDMPRLPPTAKISWRSQDGNVHERTVQLPKLKDEAIRRNTLRFTVEPNKAVTVEVVAEP